LAADLLKSHDITAASKSVPSRSAANTGNVITTSKRYHELIMVSDLPSHEIPSGWRHYRL
jgi:hypothetical protein